MAKSSNPPPKQKNLFSFFSKKEKTAPPPSAASASSAGATAKSASANGGLGNNASSGQESVRKGSSQLSAAQLKHLSKVCVGTKLAVYWPDDKEYYPCVVQEHRPKAKEDPGHVYRLNYEDGESEIVDLATERFKIIGGKKRPGDEEEGEKSNDGGKRRRIMESSDEAEFDDEESMDEGDDSGSEYKMAADDASMDDEELDADVEKEESEDDWMDSDEEEEEEAPKPKKKVAKKVTVTRVGVGSDGSKKITPTPKGDRKSPAGIAESVDFSSFASQTPVPFASNAKKPAAASSKKALSQPSPMVPQKLDPKLHGRKPEAKVPPYSDSKDVTNPSGSHMHNHLKFFTTNRHDINRRPAGHPEYSPRTLHVHWGELKGHGNITPAQEQWWNIKAQYADTVLLFKTGKFYEMFHDDADVGVSVLGHSYMKGKTAHSGFPEGAYGLNVAKLVEAGYCVARVEQTETPETMKARNKAKPKGHPKDKAVCREVCAVVSKGTRTFCYLDDVSMLDKGEASTGPLIAVKETLVEDNSMDEDGAEDSEAGTKAVYEYGVTVVDAVTGVVTLGQFADDVLRSRLLTLLTSFGPSQVLYEGGQTGASKSLLPFLKSACPPNTIVEAINQKEHFPRSTAVSIDDRITMVRGVIEHPWNGEKTVKELHKRGYYPRSSRNIDDDLSGTEGISRWPEILRRCIEGGATLAMSSFGAALYYLQRSLVDNEILTMGIVKAYAPPNTSGSEAANSASANADASGNPSNQLQGMYEKEARQQGGMDLVEQSEEAQPARSINFPPSATNEADAYASEANIDHLALDGTTLSNLEIINSITSGSHQGSLLSKIDATLSPHGSRLLRAWLLRPMFRKADIDRRADAVEELASGSAAVAMEEARGLLKKTGDIERLLSRVHSMGRAAARGDSDNSHAAAHPAERAVMYEGQMHTKRKVGDFSKLLHGLRSAADIPDLFTNADIQSPMLSKIVRPTDEGGCFPSGMKERLDWFFDNVDIQKASKGEFEPSPGMDEEYDAACATINDIKRQLDAYKDEMCSSELHPRNAARSSWKYVNLKDDSKDKYLIELPATIEVPPEFHMKGKRGKGAKQVNKYQTPEVMEMVKELERAIEIKNDGKAAGLALVFAKFDEARPMWMAATNATAMLDALGSMAQVAVRPGFTRPMILECPPSAKPGMTVVQGRHPCVDTTHSGGNFIPNDLVLGSKPQSTDDAFFGNDDSSDESEPNCLLLSGPNMGGKSTLLRQTCLITILAQMGSYVPAEQCALTPVDRIFTRLGASDRILCGQSTFFVELAETSAAVRGATRRSLVIMDELGRGTSTFDGTAIASATVKHLVEKNGCLTLFATHYHSLLEDWKNEPAIKLGHMECIVEEEEEDSEESTEKNNITFLYTLGEGPCPKSFGVNVARLAGLPDDVLQRAKRLSSEFEAEMNGEAGRHKIIPATAEKSVDDISKLFSEGGEVDAEKLKQIWQSFQ